MRRDYASFIHLLETWPVRGGHHTQLDSTGSVSISGTTGGRLTLFDRWASRVAKILSCNYIFKQGFRIHKKESEL